MNKSLRAPPRIAVVGAGVAGAACAAGLQRAGFEVAVFDKSGGVGGRMATRRAQWTDSDGALRTAEFDHGCPHFTVTRPRFRAVIDRAVSLGCANRWRQHLYAAFPSPQRRDVVVPTPNMPAFCRFLLSGVPLHLGRAVTGLQRCPEGWMLHLSEGRTEGPFDRVVLAIPATQAAMLLAGHQSEWAGALAAVRMVPCWTLMAVTADVDWPWDVAEIERSPLAQVARNDRKPGRTLTATASANSAQWVAHATPAWSLAHLEDEPEHVTAALCEALAKLLPGPQPPQWRYASVHRWRYAQLANASPGGLDCWWSKALGLGVCGDSFGNGSIEAAWRSGDELADAIAAAFDSAPERAVAPEPELADTAH